MLYIYYSIRGGDFSFRFNVKGELKDTEKIFKFNIFYLRQYSDSESSNYRLVVVA